jgi:hypothetical protein
MTGREASLVAVCLVATVGLTYIVSRPHQKQQPRVYVGDRTYAHSEWIRDFQTACPHTAFVTDEKVSDYDIRVIWYTNEQLWGL